MVQVTDKYALTDEGLIDFQKWLPLLEDFYPKQRLATIAGAIDILAQYGVDEPSVHGGTCFGYGVEMAAVLFDLQADEESVAAALLFELHYNQKISPELVLESCGEAVLKILDGATAMSAVRALQNDKPNQAQIDTFRKMLLTIVEDVRIVLVKLADRVCTMRAVKNWTESYKQTIAKEILEIYAPLANRLGLSKTKWELEDRAFACLYPVEYKKIARGLKKKRLQREAYIHDAMEMLAAELKKENIHFELSGRVKHIYSIWRKLRKKERNLDELYDIRAMRVLVDSVDECYRALSIVNQLWEPIASEFADYIATPKPNGYRSVHTVVYGPEHLTLEIQIRTQQMHNESEMGVAAHWRYKEGVKHDPSYEARVNWLRSLLDWETELADELKSDELKKELAGNRVYVFTPNGDVIDLELGSTVLDFAYMVHTMIGHRTKGAKINGKIVPLTTKLSTGDKVEILTHKEPSPSLDWSNAGSGFIYSAKIRARVARWFKQLNKEQNAALGRERLLDELKHHRLKSIDYTEVASHFNMADEETLYAGIETGSLRFNQVVNYIVEHYKLIEKPTVEEVAIKSVNVTQSLKDNARKTDLTIYGVDNLLSHMAGCCKPVQGDDIVGYLTHGRGVTVHRAVCPNFLRLSLSSPERVLDVQWGKKDLRRYQVDLLLICSDVEKAVHEVTSILTIEKITIAALQPSHSDKHKTIKLSLILMDMQTLDTLAKKMSSTAYVENVTRVIA
ncbi:RelA/SpoT family protein [Cysteiniphilum litorale]|uniref:RelA/SpoT family protein n=1 Tax=Cysteiniphilum litorale TaxID=2056700 RepID=UPI003F882AE5